MAIKYFDDIIGIYVEGRKEGNILFSNTFNIFYDDLA